MADGMAWDAQDSRQGKMDLILTEDQRVIREEARRLLADRMPSERLRAVIAEGQGVDAALWATVAAELGWCALTIPEDCDGLGLGLTELALLMEAAGERLAPIPLWETTCLATPILMALGSDTAKALLPRIAGGQSATLAFDPRQPEAACLTATPVADGFVLDGRLSPVLSPLADLVLMQARLGEGTAWFVLESGMAQQVQPLAGLDGTRRWGALRLDGVSVPASARIDDGLAPEALRHALAVAGLGLAAEQVGAARGVMDLTLAYIAERVQFGRTIASFQAIKHRCAGLEADLAEARALVYGVAATADPDTFALEVAGLRALAQDLLFRAAQEAIQLHGGVGITWEYDPHLYFKRAQSDRSLLGDPEAHLDAVAAHLLDTEAKA